MEKIFCHLCDRIQEIQIRDEEFVYNVRNEEFKIKGKRAFCAEHSQDELFHKEYDIENQKEAFRKYREKYNIISPSEIKEIRDRYNLNQREFSQLLGFGEITIARYERGSLPTNAHNQIIKNSMDPSVMLCLLEENQNKVGEEKSNKLRILLKGIIESSSDKEIIINELTKIFNHKPDKYNGFKNFSYEKFSNMVWFFSKKETPYLTKLNKLMFYADYYFFKRYDTSLSGARYIRDYYGPVPEKFQTLYDNMKNIEIIEDELGSRTSTISDSLEEELFNEKELQILDFVYEKFKDLYAYEIKEFSHEEKCWIEISNKDLIPYSYADFLDMDRIFIKK